MLDFLHYFLLGMTFSQVGSLPSFLSVSGKAARLAKEAAPGSHLDDNDMEQFVGFLSLQDVRAKQVYWTSSEFVFCFYIRLHLYVPFPVWRSNGIVTEMSLFSHIQQP